MQRRDDFLVAEHAGRYRENSKTCSACLNAGKNLKFQIPQTEKKTKIEPPKTPGEEIQREFTENLHNRKLSSSPYILIAVKKIAAGR